jgi:hypothetical protein
MGPAERHKPKLTEIAIAGRSALAQFRAAQTHATAATLSGTSV